MDSTEKDMRATQAPLNDREAAGWVLGVVWLMMKVGPLTLSNNLLMPTFIRVTFLSCDSHGMV